MSAVDTLSPSVNFPPLNDSPAIRARSYGLTLWTYLGGAGVLYGAVLIPLVWLVVSGNGLSPANMFLFTSFTTLQTLALSSIVIPVVFSLARLLRGYSVTPVMGISCGIISGVVTGTITAASLVSQSLALPSAGISMIFLLGAIILGLGGAAGASSVATRGASQNNPTRL